MKKVLFSNRPDRIQSLIAKNQFRRCLLIFHNPYVLKCRGGGSGGQGGRTPTQILAEQKAPPGKRGVSHCCLPTKIFRPCAIPELSSVQWHCCCCWWCTFLAFYPSSLIRTRSINQTINIGLIPLIGNLHDTELYPSVTNRLFTTPMC